MNRHERRKERRDYKKEFKKLEKEAKSNPLLCNPDQYIRQKMTVTLELGKIQKMLNEAYDKGDAAGCYRTYMYAMAAALLALRDQFHFGHDRGNRFISTMMNKIAYSISSDEDVQEVYDTMGIDVDIRKIVSMEDAEKYAEEIRELESRLGRENE